MLLHKHQIRTITSLFLCLLFQVSSLASGNESSGKTFIQPGMIEIRVSGKQQIIRIQVSNPVLDTDQKIDLILDHSEEYSLKVTIPESEDPNDDLIIDDPEGFSIVVEIPESEDPNDDLIIDDPEGYSVAIIIPESEDPNDDLIIDDPEGQMRRITVVSVIRSERDRN